MMKTISNASYSALLLLSLCILHFPTQAQQITSLTDTTTTHITVKATTIYNNGNVIGSYKEQSIGKELTFIKVYNLGHSRIAEVTHEQGAPTWTIVTPVDQKKMYAPYLAAAPLAGLFRYLVLQGYL